MSVYAWRGGTSSSTPVPERANSLSKVPTIRLFPGIPPQRTKLVNFLTQDANFNMSAEKMVAGVENSWRAATPQKGILKGSATQRSSSTDNGRRVHFDDSAMSSGTGRSFPSPETAPVQLSPAWVDAAEAGDGAQPPGGQSETATRQPATDATIGAEPPERERNASRKRAECVASLVRPAVPRTPLFLSHVVPVVEFDRPPTGNRPRSVSLVMQKRMMTAGVRSATPTMRQASMRRSMADMAGRKSRETSTLAPPSSVRILSDCLPVASRSSMGPTPLAARPKVGGQRATLPQRRCSSCTAP